NSTKVTSPTSATANITIALGASPGFRDVRVTTGGETAALLNGFEVQAFVDTTPPITTLTVLSPPNAAGWHKTAVTVELTATDSEFGGTGVAQLHATLTGAQTGAVDTTSASASIVIDADGVTTVKYFAVDNAGNVETARTF